MDPIHAIEKAAVDVEHVVVNAFSVVTKAAKVLEVAITNQDELKRDAIELVKLCETVGADSMVAISQRGLNLAEDAVTAQAIGALGVYLKTTFVPLIEKLYGQIKTEVEAQPAD